MRTRTQNSTFRVRPVQDEKNWEVYRLEPAYGFHCDATKCRGIERVEETAASRSQAREIAGRLNQESR